MAKKESPRELLPGLAKQLAEAKHGHIGVDEAGRGCLAGPVCAAAVYVPQGFDFSIFAELNDSKKLTPEKRERLEAEIKAAASKTGLLWGIGLSWAPEIDRINILNATFRAMSRAVLCLECVAGNLPEKTPPLFIDGPHAIPEPQWDNSLALNTTPLPRQFPVVKGDSLVPSISAASILAKVHRDRLMRALDRRYPDYSFSTHKGYGTKQHMLAITTHGFSEQHRKTFGVKHEEKQLPLL